MAGNAPASMLYESTVLLLNYTGIDAHTVKQHGSSIMIYVRACNHVVMISCPEWNSNPWPFDSESNALSTELSGQKAASRIGLYLQ